MDVPALLKRLELRANDTHLIVDQEALFEGDHPELALEDLRARLAADERLVAELEGHTLRIALPRRMQLRGGRSWSTGQETPSSHPKPDPTLVDGLRRAHVLAAYDEAAKRSPYERALRKVAFLSPDAQRAILEGRQPAGLTLQALLRAEPPLSWREHGSWLGQMAHSNSTRASAVNGDTLTQGGPWQSPLPGNLRACQLLLGHRKLESTVRHLGIELDDALTLSEQVDL